MLKLLGMCGAVIIGTMALPAFAQEPLETETARLPAKGALELSGLFEWQTSSTGRESAIPFALEYGIQKRLAFLIEPVLNTRVDPRFGRHASGAGDLETTLTYLLRPETAHKPAFAVAGEVKFPTAHDKLIGTGVTDYAGYLIVSKRYGKMDTHFNLGYTLVGQSVSGIHLNNLYFAALAGDYRLSQRVDLVGEIFGNTAASGEATDGNGTGGQTTSEVAGGEFVGMLGGRYRFQSNRTFFLAVSEDNNSATLVRSGVTINF